MNSKQLRSFLDNKVHQYNQPDFIVSDPIQIPKKLERKEDIEIMAFLIATIAWGQRTTIINNGNKLLQFMAYEPYKFVMYASDETLLSLEFKHRTFNAVDLRQFILSLRHIYKNHGGLETVFSRYDHMKDAIHHFKNTFFEIPHESRTLKHVSDPYKGSAAKRINMYLRWMVRQDNSGVDFGLWNSIRPSRLMMPLDVHTQNVGRALGLLKRKQNDWRSVEELTDACRQFDVADPVKYDFALFGLGVFEGLK